MGFLARDDAGAVVGGVAVANGSPLLLRYGGGAGVADTEEVTFAVAAAAASVRC